MARIKAALNRLVSGSPHSAQRLNLLLANGNVVLAYRPDDLKNAHGGENVATFLPDFRAQSSSPRQRKEFLVVIGQHGVKWPADELAATLAHELSGHAMQDHRGWLSSTRHLDAECEANLHEEIANQELGLDKRSRRSVAFRQALENRWCSDFKAYMQAHWPEAIALWDQQNPDIPALLAIFERYKQHNAGTGVTARAIDALKRQSRESRRRAFRGASPEMLLQMARKLRDGGIGIRQDPEEALRYFRLAAQSSRKTSVAGAMGATPPKPDGLKSDGSVIGLTAPTPFGAGFGKSEYSQQR